MSDTSTTSTNPSLLVRIGNFFFQKRNGLFPVVFVLLALVVPPAQFGGDRRLDLIAMVVGTVMALAGQAVRCGTIGLVYIVRGGLKGRIYADDLITEGIYAHTRNPMYLGNILIAAGICIVYGSAWMYLGALAFFLLVYVSITLAEENYLRRQFGDVYDAYCRATNRYWPSLKGFGKTLAQHRFEKRYVLKKEYGTVFGLLLGLYAIMLWKYYRVYAPLPERPVLLLIPLVPLFAFYGTARWLKKTRRLNKPKVQPDSER